ncbi:Mitogen-activated protein kinase kinase kinase 2 [Diplonema papillatum]|nr:Mitogen-activated protein kinase kinase kinase 2 [Diplonema papillatum]
MSPALDRGEEEHHAHAGGAGAVTAAAEAAPPAKRTADVLGVGPLDLSAYLPPEANTLNSPGMYHIPRALQPIELACPPTNNKWALPPVSTAALISRRITPGSHRLTRKGLSLTGRPLSITLVDFSVATDAKARTEDLESLQHELALMKRLSHPHIVDYVGVSWLGQRVSILCELVPSGTVAEVLATIRLSEQVVKCFAKQLVAAAAYLEALEVLHGNISPETALLTHEGVVKLCDFSLSSTAPCFRSVSEAPEYKAPEMLLGFPSALSDVWSIGVFSLQMVTGTPPPRKALQKKATSPSLFTPAVPQAVGDLADFVTGCLTYDYMLRPTAAQLEAHPCFKDVVLVTPSQE